jgi:photosystem II stability/assembly factor-like uncharacterized protein
MRHPTNTTLSLLSLAILGCAGDSALEDSPEAIIEEGRVRHAPRLTPQASGTTNRLQAVSPVNRHVVWASGIGGTWAVTTDGGRTWRSGVVPGAESLQFRDVEGFSAREAVLLAAGVGTDSRVYRTDDGGATWRLTFQNQDPNGFYDCFAFWSRRRGITMADAIAGRFPVIATSDGGRTWVDIGDALPEALLGEAAFAASGTCVATHGHRRAWIVTGGAERSRVLATTDGGASWAAYEQPIVQGTPTSGATSIAFRSARHGVLGGGEILAPTEFAENFARSDDGGRTWELGTPTPFPGAIYGLAYAGWGRTVVATGPSGAAWSPDEGDRWLLLDGVANYWAVAFAGRTGWLVGTEGRILRIDF